MCAFTKDITTNVENIPTTLEGDEAGPFPFPSDIASNEGFALREEHETVGPETSLGRVNSINRGARSILYDVSLPLGKPCSLKRHFTDCLRQVIGFAEVLAAADSDRFVWASQAFRKYALKKNGKPYSARQVFRSLQTAELLGILKPAKRTVNGVLRAGYIVAKHDHVASAKGNRCVLNLTANNYLPRKRGQKRAAILSLEVLQMSEGRSFDERGKATSADQISLGVPLQKSSEVRELVSGEGISSDTIEIMQNAENEGIGLFDDRHRTGKIFEPGSLNPSSPENPAQAGPIKKNPRNPTPSTTENRKDQSAVEDAVVRREPAISASCGSVATLPNLKSDAVHGNISDLAIFRNDVVEAWTWSKPFEDFRATTAHWREAYAYACRIGSEDFLIAWEYWICTATLYVLKGEKREPLYWPLQSFLSSGAPDHILRQLEPLMPVARGHRRDDGSIEALILLLSQSSKLDALLPLAEQEFTELAARIIEYGWLPFVVVTEWDSIPALIDEARHGHEFNLKMKANMELWARNHPEEAERWAIRKKQLGGWIAAL